MHRSQIQIEVLVRLVENLRYRLNVSKLLVEQNVLQFDLNAFREIHQVDRVLALLIQEKVEIEFVVDRVIKVRIVDGRVSRDCLANVGYLFDLLRVVLLAFFECLDQLSQLVFIESYDFVFLFEQLILVLVDDVVLFFNHRIPFFDHLCELRNVRFLGLFGVFARLVKTLSLRVHVFVEQVVVGYLANCSIHEHFFHRVEIFRVGEAYKSIDLLVCLGCEDILAVSTTFKIAYIFPIGIAIFV
jgi:hypothetical protein